jgi:signal transduction histidine kinase
MAEIAANVLHNVGNVLNSVNVSAGLIAARMRESKAKGLANAVQLIDDHAGELQVFLTRDERGKRLPGYLHKLAAALVNERSTIMDELEALTKGVDHIRDIVATQQSYAGSISLTEPVDIEALLEDALHINATAIARREVTVIKEYSKIPRALLDKHLLLQILVNLIANALQAMEGVADRPPRLSLRADAVADNQGLRLRIQVKDNGEGISPQNIPRLFAHGFTTRRHGHGFGLHSGALAAVAMGGELAAHSDGANNGAIFTLDLPLKELAMPELAIKAVANLK